MKRFAVFAAAGIFFAGLLFSCLNIVLPEIWSEGDTFRRENYRELVKENGRDFKILQLADTHIGSYIGHDFDAVEETFNMIREDIGKVNPDLLILTGDNVIASNLVNTLWAQRLIAFLDNFHIPYIIAMGNHDGGGFFDTKNDNRRMVVAEVFASGRYSLFRQGPVNIGGTGNYGVNIVNPSRHILYSIIVMDDASEQQYFTGEQVKWYEWYVRGISAAEYGSYLPPAQVVPSMAVFHIPLPETNNARDALAASDPGLAADWIRESPCVTSRNTGMFQKMKDLDSTKHLFFGHDHDNMLYYQYQGIYFVYGVKTGPCSANLDRQGTTLITLKDDLSVTVEFLIH